MLNGQQPLVIQLQMAAMDTTTSVCGLLFKAQIVARKLGLGSSDIAQWIGHELEGYVGPDVVLPRYRMLNVRPVAIHPMRGDIPILVDPRTHPAVLKALFEMPLPNPLSEIEALIETGQANDMRSSFDPDLQHLVSQLIGHRFPGHHCLGPGQLNAVVEAVRGRAITWALDLEAGGVIGADFHFTLNEKAAAMTITNNFTNSNIGTVGDVTTGAQVTNTQTLSNAVSVDKVAAFLRELEPAMAGLPAEVKTAIAQPVATLTAEARSSTPSQSTMRGALTSIKTACEGAAGNLIASGVLGLVGPLLG